MNQKRIDDSNGSKDPNRQDRSVFTLAAATFVLVFALGVLITNWPAFAPS